MPTSGAVGPRLQAAFREGNWSSELRRVVERGQELARDVRGARGRVPSDQTEARPARRRGRAPATEASRGAAWDLTTGVA